jgi:GNAT superfamily N-acetyltransferase
MPEPNSPQLLLSEWSAELTTRSGLRLKVRPAAPEDEALLEAFFGRVAPEDLRFRFLSAVKKPGHALLAPLVNVDHVSTENFLAFADDGEKLLATAMMAADPDLERAEVAIAIRADSKHRGIGWTLLDHVADYATARGIGMLESIESRDNRAAIGIELEKGFTAVPYPGEATLVLLRKRLR